MSVVLYCLPCDFGVRGITNKVNKISRNAVDDGCFRCGIVTGSHGKFCCIGGVQSRYIYILVDIHNMKINVEFVST